MRISAWAALAVIAVAATGYSPAADPPEAVASASPTASAPARDETPQQPTTSKASQQPMSSSDVARRVGGCLTERGWDVTVGWDSVRSNASPEQMDAYQVANDECYALVTADLPPPPTLTPERAAEEYEAQVLYRECLQRHGVEVPALPSYQKFEDDLLTRGELYDGSWEAGLPPGHSLRAECKDPLDTWGHNADYRAGARTERTSLLRRPLCAIVADGFLPARMIARRPSISRCCPTCSSGP